MGLSVHTSGTIDIITGVLPFENETEAQNISDVTLVCRPLRL